MPWTSKVQPHSQWNQLSQERKKKNQTMKQQQTQFFQEVTMVFSSLPVAPSNICKLDPEEPDRTDGYFGISVVERRYKIKTSCRYVQMKSLEIYVPETLFGKLQKESLGIWLTTTSPTNYFQDWHCYCCSENDNLNHLMILEYQYSRWLCN